MKALLLSLVFAFFAGCASAGRINNISVGMTKREVIDAMGPPSSTSAASGLEYLNYKLSETDDDEFRGRYTGFFVKLINGRVQSYGREGDFDSTQPPTIRIEKREISRDE